MSLAAFRRSPDGADPFGWFRSACQCGACETSFKAEDALVAAESALTLSAVARVQRDELDYAPSESGGEEFLSEELALFALLLAMTTKPYQSFADKAEDILENSIRPEDDLDRLIDNVTPEMSRLFDEHQPEVKKLVFQTMDTGEAMLAENAIQELISRKFVGDGIVKATGYYTNKFFNTVIVPDIQNQMRLALEDPYSNLNRPNFSRVIEVLNKRLKSVPYWRVVANAAASRGFHYGYLKTMEILQIPGYRLQAVLDLKTSDICRTLNGKTFWVNDAVDVLERAYTSDDPEAVKQASPWKPYKEIKELSRDELKALGVMVPPFHGSCRTSIVPVYGTADV